MYVRDSWKLFLCRLQIRRRFSYFWIILKVNIFIMDNASWHKAGRLKWGNIKPVYLPPYSPELNPIERL